MENAAESVAAEPARYCKKCGYALRGLSAPRCPECGRAFDPANAKTYLTKPRKRRWRWVRRAGVAVLMLFLLVAAAWGWEYWGWKQEQWALAGLKPAEVTVKAHLPAWIDPDGESRAGWLNKHLGSQGAILNRVRWISIEGDASVDLKPLLRLQLLKGVHFFRTFVYDPSTLDQCAELVDLQLSACDVKDFPQVSGLTKLRLLSTVMMDIKDCSPVAKLTKLEYLSLMNTSVCDISPLASLSQLRGLVLYGSKVTDLRPLSGLTTSLKNLDLSETPVRDLTPLYTLKALRRLGLKRDMPQKEVDALKRALPGCTVVQF